MTAALARHPEVPLAITVFIRYQLDPFKREMFEQYARRWLTIIPRCGGDLVGYWMPHEGTDNIAFALISFENLAPMKIIARGFAPTARAWKISILPKKTNSSSRRSERSCERWRYRSSQMRKEMQKMIAVIFEVWPKPEHKKEYLDLAAELKPILETSMVLSRSNGSKA